MEISILKEEKNILEVELKGETHTLLNALRQALWNLDDTELASYTIKHPLVTSPVLVIRTKNGKPRKALSDVITLLKKQNKEFKSLIKKV